MKGVHHISLKVRGAGEFRRVLEFYETTLECPAVRRWGEGDGQGAMLDLGNTLLEVTASGDAAGRPLSPPVAFATAGPHALRERAGAAGRPVIMEPSDKNLGGNYPIRVAFCTGPAGEEIEFFQER